MYSFGLISLHHPLPSPSTTTHFRYLLFSCVLLLWLYIIFKHVFCWRGVVRNKLAVHNHLHHREKMALSMITQESQLQLIPAAKSGAWGSLQRAARKIAIDQEIVKATKAVNETEKHKSRLKRVIVSLLTIKKWYAHNFGHK